MSLIHLQVLVKEVLIDSSQLTTNFVWLQNMTKIIAVLQLTHNDYVLDMRMEIMACTCLMKSVGIRCNFCSGASVCITSVVLNFQLRYIRYEREHGARSVHS